MLGTTAAKGPPTWHRHLEQRLLTAPGSSTSAGTEKLCRVEAKCASSADSTGALLQAHHMPRTCLELHVTPFDHHENLGGNSALAVQWGESAGSMAGQDSVSPGERSWEAQVGLGEWFSCVPASHLVVPPASTQPSSLPLWIPEVQTCGSWKPVLWLLRIWGNIFSRARLPRWLSGKESTCQCRRHRFDSWSRNIPWNRKWQPTPAFLPGEPYGERNLAGYSLWGLRIGHNLATKQQLL